MNSLNAADPQEDEAAAKIISKTPTRDLKVLPLIMGTSPAAMTLAQPAQRKAAPNRASALRLASWMRQAKKTIAVQPANIATSLSRFFEGSRKSNGAGRPDLWVNVKNGKIPATNSLWPWRATGALIGAASPLVAGLGVAAANTPPAQTPDASSAYNAIPPGIFGYSNFLHIAALIAVTVGGYFLWKKYGTSLRQKISDWKMRRSGAGKASSDPRRVSLALSSSAHQRAEEAPLPKITFADVAGQEKAIAQIKKFLDAFGNPQKFRKVNASFKPQNAFVLVGPPGTGKTLIANAIAGELGIDKESFFDTGVAFTNKFVGTGADAVRGLFEKAREQSRKTGGPAMIFMDELDGLGNRGGNSAGGESNDENRKTVNEVLREMNNLSGPGYNILLVGGTNEFGHLDKALTRSGRFGTHIVLERLDAEGRRKILELYMKNMKAEPDVDLKKIAEKIAGFSGADIKEIATETTLLVANAGREAYSQTDIEEAVEEVKKNSREKAASVNSSNNAHNFRFEDPENIATTLGDVAGQDDAKGEIAELVDQIKNREKYIAINPQFRPARGALLFGPPGTGKTMMARAIAKESGALFFRIDGTDFLKKFVGEGPEIIRELFRTAAYESEREQKPAIIFIDEIDAVAKARGSDASGSGDTLVNQLLTEIDGFNTAHNVTVIGATNKPESLDPALMRGGRLEIQIPVGKPDVFGREAILKNHTRQIRLADDVDLKKVAAQTTGFSGADLESLVMKATSLSAKSGESAISQADFIAAIDRVQLGMERKLVMPEDEKEVVAYHETGHALVSHLLPDADPIRKVTIVPHGLNALGLMQAASDVERSIQSRSYLVARMAVALGGRAGEELMSERIRGKRESFSGASNDLEQATKIARYMVMKFGMSEKAGLVSYGFENERQAARPSSEKMRQSIENEVKALIQEAYHTARTTLESHWEIFKAAAEELKAKETLRGEDFDRLIPKAKNPSHPS